MKVCLMWEKNRYTKNKYKFLQQKCQTILLINMISKLREKVEKNDLFNFIS
jgi:hypothetical protein